MNEKIVRQTGKLRSSVAPEPIYAKWPLSLVPEDEPSTNGESNGHKPANLQRVEAALLAHGSTFVGGQDWTCPGHDDEHASLGITTGKDGRVLVNCQAGCAPEEVVKAVGLTMHNLAGSDNKPRVVAAYDYTDENEVPLYRVTRWINRPQGKCTQAAFRSDGTLRTGRGAMDGVRRVLYRLPDVLAAAADGGVVYVVEGEKDALALQKIGEIATTNSEGAGKWVDEYSAALVGARVVVVPDRDVAGYKHARQVVESLRRAGVASVRVVAPVPQHKGRHIRSSRRRLHARRVGAVVRGRTGTTRRRAGRRPRRVDVAVRCRPRGAGCADGLARARVMAGC